MTIVSRIRKLNLPTDQFIVIGSGLLDAYGLRQADDIDLVVSDSLYQTLRETGLYNEQRRHDEDYLFAHKQEIWRTWGGEWTFSRLQHDSVTVDGIKFVNPTVLIAKKRERGSVKDINDIAMLEKYLLT